MPGGLSGWISWKPHEQVLSKKHQVIRMQLLSIAAAEKGQVPQKGYSLRSESEALKNTLNKLGTEKVNLVGWSYGATISLDFALNNPERIASLTLIEPGAFWIARAYKKFEKEEHALRELSKTVHNPPTEDDLIRFLNFIDPLPPDTDPRSLPRWPDWNKRKMVLLNTDKEIDHSDNIARLKLLSDKPVLLVKGKDSSPDNVGIINLLAKEIAGQSKILTLPDGHACHIVAQDQFINELEQLIPK